MTTLARLLMRQPIVRRIVRERRAEIAGGRILHTWNDLLGTFPGVVGVKTGHTSAAGWNEAAAVDRGGVYVFATILGSPDRTARNADLTRLLRWALSRFRRVPVIRGDRVYANVKLGYGRGDLGLVARAPLARAVRVDRPLVEKVVAKVVAPLPVLRGEPLGEVRVYQGPRLVGRSVLVAERSVSRPGALGRIGYYASGTAEHMWGWIH